MGLLSEIKRKNIPHGSPNSPKQLIKEDKKPLVLFGEANFTHAVAIATLRGSTWDDITATCLRPAGDDDLCKRFRALQIENDEATEELIENLFETALQTAILNSNCELVEDNDHKRIATALKKLNAPCSTDWKFKVDATNIKDSDDVTVQGKIAWFQCPWEMGGPSRLVEHFVKHMDEKEAEYILIGITTHEDYVERYQLENILSDKAQSKVDHYMFLGSDDELIRDILKYGYKHHTEVDGIDIHIYISNEHLTLVFKRIVEE